MKLAKKCKICRRPADINGDKMCCICADNYTLLFQGRFSMNKIKQRKKYAIVKKETLKQIRIWDNMDKPIIRLKTCCTLAIEI